MDEDTTQAMTGKDILGHTHGFCCTTSVLQDLHDARNHQAPTKACKKKTSAVIMHLGYLGTVYITAS